MAVTGGASSSRQALVGSAPLPGIPNIWTLQQTSPEVAEVSLRIVQLQQLLACSDADVVWMVVREPALLTADFDALTQRLFDMKIASIGSGTDVVAVVVQQPALLLTPRWRLSGSSSGSESSSDGDSSESDGEFRADAGASASTSSTEGGSSGGGSGGDQRQRQQQQQQQQQHDMLNAWQHGLSGDDGAEWAACYQSLIEYQLRHGDAGAGFRDGDDAGLARWARKQRGDHRLGTLLPDRLLKLEAMGFAFTDEEADWQRWFNELRTFQQVAGHCSPMPLSAGVDFYLINWCSVQRIARRSRVLTPARVAQLDTIGFDWTGADPLS